MSEIFTKQINENQFSDFVESNEGLALFEFISPNSGWCLLMIVQLQKLLQHYNNTINHYQINIKESTSLVSEFNVKTIPKYLLYKNQKLICTFEGLIPFDELKEIISIAIEN